MKKNINIYKKSIISAALIVISLSSYGQFKVPKFGKVSLNELNMSSYPADSSANAVILFDAGKTQLLYNKVIEAFELTTERHVRIKIFNRDGLDWAEVSIPFYKTNSESEKITGLKALTYNLIDGKIEETKLTKKAVFNVEKNENWTIQKFTLPQVKEGSVIEYTYTITSPFTFSLQPWDFQSSIPTIYSEYEVKIPEYYRYQSYVSGYENVVTTKSTNPETIVFTETVRTYNGPSQYYSSKVTYTSNNSKYIAQNLPALKDDSFVDNIENYLTSIEFELQSTEFPGASFKLYTESWETIVKKLIDHQEFGRQLSSANFIKNDIQNIVNDSLTQNEKVTSIISFLKTKVKWNGKYRLYCENGVKNAYKNGSGNSVELNMLLILLLREAGINAYPIALSTRSNGVIQPWQKTINRLNHVIAGIEIDNGLNLYDATSEFNALNVLPLECINGQGRMIDEKNNKWINLNPEKLSSRTVYAEIVPSENGDIKASVITNQHDYFSQQLHYLTNSEEKLNKFKERISRDFNNGQIDSLTIEYSALKNAEVKSRFQVTTSDFISTAGDFIYLTPGKGFLMTSNNLTSNERKLPINFHFPQEEMSIIKYKIPEGYVVDELPTNDKITGLEGKVQYLYSIAQIGEEIVLTCRSRINKMLFLPSEYPDFKKFFDSVATKNSEKIVLKKGQ